MDLRINIATPNGTGSLTANSVLTKIIFKNNLFCTSKNLFPSNIAGLPTWFNLRLSDQKFSGFKDKTDIYVGFNKSCILKDLKDLNKEKTILITNKDFKLDSVNDFKNLIQLPIRELTKPLCDSPSLRKLLGNLVYVGFITKLLNCDKEVSLNVLKKEFLKRSEELFNLNKNAFLKGFEFSLDQNEFNFDKKIRKSDFSEDHLIDGNTAAALGFLDGGASIVTWYPITPSSSLVENFKSFSENIDTKDRVTVLQCEDEISSAVSVLGAGWSGARAFTATSGPGLSLMQEAIGLGYYAEVPMVIADVQRAGPSTGLPTRTAQGDLLLAHYSSHGDTLHPVFLPSSPQELYDDSFNSLNAADVLQTPVILMSDLDLGMNTWPTKEIKRENKINKGKVELKPNDNFKRYSLSAKDLPVRSIPRLSDKSLSYFTRGSGHDESGNYSEDPKVYKDNLEKLKNKVVNNRNLIAKDIYSINSSDFSIIYYGSTSQIITELESLLKISFSTYQVRALPVDKELYSFARKHKLNFVIEQNRDGQMSKIIKSESSFGDNFISVTQFDGLPASAKHFAKTIDKLIKDNA